MPELSLIPPPSAPLHLYCIYGKTLSEARALRCHTCWTLIACFVCYLSECSRMHTHGSRHQWDQCELLIHWLIFCVFQRVERATDLKDQLAHWTFCHSDRSPGTMLTILAAGSMFFPGLFLLSKQCLKSIPALRWSEGDAVIVSARSVQYFSGFIIKLMCSFFLRDSRVWQDVAAAFLPSAFSCLVSA